MSRSHEPRPPRRPARGMFEVTALNGAPRERRFRKYTRAVAYAEAIAMATIDQYDAEGRLEPISTVFGPNSRRRDS